MTEPKTLREIGQELRISHQTVAEVLERAYKKVRKILKERGIRLEDLV